MDVSETFKPPLVPVDKNNATIRRTREVTSRYRSPSVSNSSSLRRCPSPNGPRTVGVSGPLPKRSSSAERRRPSTPTSPTSPSTPVRDTLLEMQMASRQITGSRMPEVLWPSTMRSLTVSFQSDKFSLPVGKREKPATHVLSSNRPYRQDESPTISRKPTPERKRSPLKGKNTSDQSENSKPLDGAIARLADQHRWPSRTTGKVSSIISSRSLDLTDRTIKASISLLPGIGVPSLRRLSLSGGTSNPLQRAASGAESPVSYTASERGELEGSSIDDDLLGKSGMQKRLTSNSLEITGLLTPTARSQSLPITISRPASPNKTLVSSSFSRGVSPSRTSSVPSARGVSPVPSARGVSPVPSARGVSPVPSARGVSPVPSPRGVSPSRRPSSPSRQSNSSTSVLTFTADIKRGKKSANYIEDAHQLKLLYSRHLQWCFINASADAALNNQKVTSEKMISNVWRNTLKLWDSVIQKRIDLQQLKLKLKLCLILNEQMAWLCDWTSIERDHISSLIQAIDDLQASTLHLPVTGGAKVDMESLQAAVCSAVDVMQEMGSSISSVLSQVDGIGCLVSEFADVAAQERAMLDECEALLAALGTMQLEEYSHRAHLIQLKTTLEEWQSPTLARKQLYTTQ